MVSIYVSHLKISYKSYLEMEELTFGLGLSFPAPKVFLIMSSIDFATVVVV